MLLRTTAPAPTVAPPQTTLPSTTAPASMTAPAPTVVPPVSRASAATLASPRTRNAPTAHERLRGSDVQPVGRLGIAHHDRAGLDQAGKRLPLDRDDPAGRDLVDDRPAEDVAASVDLVRHRVRSLLQERGD